LASSARQNNSSKFQTNSCPYGAIKHQDLNKKAVMYCCEFLQFNNNADLKEAFVFKVCQYTNKYFN
jgi:hypothetical protein